MDGIYQAITHCQTLYPDPEQSDSDVEGDEVEEVEEIDLESGDFFTTADGLNHLSPQGLATLSHLERILQLPNSSEMDSTVSNGDGKRACYQNMPSNIDLLPYKLPIVLLTRGQQLISVAIALFTTLPVQLILTLCIT